MIIKNRIALHLKAKGMEQLELSRQLGLTPVAVNRWCTNRRNPSQGVQKKLAEILGVQVKDLFYLAENE